MRKDDKYLIGGTIAAFILLLALRWLDWNLYLQITTEDGLIENFTAAAFIVAAIYAFALAIHRDRRHYHFSNQVIAFALFLVLLVCGMDEISWGQRIFDFQTPEAVLEVNTHKETTIHNIYPVQQSLDWIYMAAGIYGMLSGLVYTAMPIHLQRTIEACGGKILVVPPKYAFVFVPIFVQSFWWYFLRGYGCYDLDPGCMLAQPDEEPAELFFAWGWLLTARDKLRTSRPTLPA